MIAHQQDGFRDANLSLPVGTPVVEKTDVSTENITDTPPPTDEKNLSDTDQAATTSPESGSVQQLETDEDEYPRGTTFALIITALVLSVFLSSLDIVCACACSGAFPRRE